LGGERTSASSCVVLALALMMAAFMSNSPGRQKIINDAAVPPIMCSTEPRSDTVSDVATLLQTKTNVTVWLAHSGIERTPASASSKSCTHAVATGADRGRESW
jgi:hypothetical protein